MSLLQVEDTNRTIRHSQIINLNESLIKRKQEDSKWLKLLKRLIPKKHQRTTSRLYRKQKIYTSLELYLKQMELIDDPIYTVYRLKKKTLFQKIVQFMNFFKVIEPQTTWLIYWNMIIGIIILYYFFEIGIVVFLGITVWQDQLNSPITYTLNVAFIICLFLDIFVQSNTGYYFEGTLILDKLKIVKNYAKKYFVIDIIGVLMVAICFFSENMILNYFKMFFYGKLLTLRKIDIIYQKMLVFHLKWNIIYLISRQIVIVLMSTHYLGVVFWSIDNYIYTNNYYGPTTPLLCWAFNANAYSQLAWEPWYYWYLYSFYFSLGTMTTIAYGDITPLNPIDTMYVILVLIICCIQFSYVLFNIIEILLLGRAAKSQRDNQNLQINKYMKMHFISNKLQVRVKAFIEETWNAQMYRNRTVQKQMIIKLPKQLRIQLLLSIYEQFGIQLLAFKYPKSFIQTVIELIEQFRCSRQQNIIKAHEPLKKVYYLVSGKIDFYLNSQLHIKTLSKTSIGVIEFYTEQDPVFSVKATQDSNLYTIDIQKLLDLMRKNPLTFQIMKNISDQCRDQQRKCQLFNIKCFICQEATHMCIKCPNSHYIFEPLNILQVSSKKKQQRHQFKRYSIRRRLKKYYDRRKSSQEWQPNQIITKYQSTLNEVYELNICNDLDLNNVELFVEQTMQLLQSITETLNNLQQKQEDEWSIDIIRSFPVYLKQYNISHVIRKLKKSG